MDPRRAQPGLTPEAPAPQNQPARGSVPTYRRPPARSARRRRLLLGGLGLALLLVVVVVTFTAQKLNSGSPPSTHSSPPARANPTPATPIVGMREFALPSLSSRPWGITRGPDGNLWFVE